MLLDKNYNEVEIDKFIPFVIENNMPRFLMKITHAGELRLCFDIYKVYEYIRNNDILEYNIPHDIGLYMSIIMASNRVELWFGALQQDNDRHNGYVYLGGSDGWDNHIQLMTEIRDYAGKHINNVNNN